MKASGQGLSSRLHTWHALPPARGLAEFTIRDANGRSWQLHDLEMDENHVLCVATAPGAAVGSPVMLGPGWLARLWY